MACAPISRAARHDLGDSGCKDFITVEVEQLDRARDLNKPLGGRYTSAAVSGRSNAQTVAGDYELRLLRVPALYFVALWLRDRQGGQDLLVLLQPAQSPLVAGKLYPAGQVEAELRKQASARAAFDDCPKPLHI